MIQSILIQFQFLSSILASVFLVLGLGGLSQSIPAFRFTEFTLPMTGALGILFLGMIALLSNFFAPLGSVFLMILIILAILGLIRIRHRFVSLDLFLICFIAILYWFIGVRTPPVTDTGLYHLPLIQWMHSSSLPLGLANLHDRFGTWNFWFSVCGAVSAGNLLPFAVYSMNVVILALACADWIRAILSEDKPSQKFTFSILLIILFVYLDLWHVIRGQKSPDADFAGSIVALWSVYYFVQRKDSPLTSAIACILLSGLATLMKINQAPLCLMTLYFIYEALRKKQIAALLPVISLIFFGGIFMIFKSFWCTGCLVFPLQASCLNTPWTINPSTLANYFGWVKSWARAPGIAPEIVLKDWAWFPNWFHAFTQEKIVFLIPCSFVGFLLMKIFGNRFKRIAPVSSFDFAALIISLFGILYWFMGAPDLRFGYGYFAAIFVLLGMPVAQTLFPIRFRKHFAGITLIFIFVSIGGQLHRADDLGASTLVHPIPPLTGKLNSEAQTIYVPANENCWDAPVPCTPYFETTLRKTNLGYFPAFLRFSP